jgi:hypothetical protein
MSDPIKTQLLNAIVTSLEAVPGVNGVMLWPANIPNDATLRPFIAVFDESEKVKRENRYRVATFNLHLETWMMTKADIENFSNTMEKIHADFIKIFHDVTNINNQAIHQLCQKTEETQFEKLLWSEVECAFTNIYEVKYRTLWDDPYSMEP